MKAATKFRAADMASLLFVFCLRRFVIDADRVHAKPNNSITADQRSLKVSVLSWPLAGFGHSPAVSGTQYLVRKGADTEHLQTFNDVPLLSWHLMLAER